MPTKKKTIKSKPVKRAAARISRTQQPQGMDVDTWQAALRRQFGREQNFTLQNIGDEPIFSEFAVGNPQSARSWRVAIRGTELGQNYCACPDFATNELGTCKHIEFTLGALERKRGGRGALARGFAPGYSEVWLQYGARRRVRFRAGRHCPAALRARAAACFTNNANEWSLSVDRFAAFSDFEAAAQRSRHEVRIYADARRFIDNHICTQQRQEDLRSAFPGGCESPALQHLLALPLYPYQAEGAWFAVNAGRALIADEMGLGKTIQAIAAAEIAVRHLGAQRVLIVCPTSLKHQWQQEVLRLAQHEAVVVSGARKARIAQYARPATWLITNYDILKFDASLIAAWSPDVVIADEAQRIKNWDTVAARHLKQIHSNYAFVLTGTPLENRLRELLSIVQFVDQHRLGPTWRFMHEHQEYDDSGRVIGYRNLHEIGATLAPIMLRRRKADVLKQLPSRSDRRIVVELTPEQATMHEEFAQIVARIVARWRKKRFLTDKEQKQLMAALQGMRMACDTTYLIDGKTDKGTKIPELLQLLDEMLLEPDVKVVVFSQWLGCQHLIGKALDARGIDHVKFNGALSAARRGALVKQFCDDAQCRVFLSSDAGGLGLNLQPASVVINVDLPWNPAVLEQRIGRVHRLGQQRPVQVINLVAARSIEEGMLSLLAFKQSLFSGVLDGGESNVTLEGTRLSRFMKQVEQATAPANAPPAAPTALDTAPAPKPVARDASAAPMPESADTTPTDTPATASSVAAVNPWQPLLAVGARLIDELSRSANENVDSRAVGNLVQRDPHSGERYLRLPVPEPEAVEQLATALLRLLAGPAK
ncbi:MAG: superfamily II DNA or RNA helicase [Gammaproteobacteria bacterium]|jgi:superfamily II DNA or RNA helicase